MSVRVLRNADYKRMRWKNGGGWTTELAAATAPDRADTFDWRISIAEIESDGPFSTFAGCDRQIALLDGSGMQIDFDQAPPLRLDQRLRFFAFAGEWTARGRLLGGPVRDFNVIVRRDSFRAEALHRPLVGPMVFLPEAGTSWFVYLVGGQAELKDSTAGALAAGVSLLLEPDDAGRSRVLTGGGEVVLVKLTRR
jgi:environmental stress-induced protein Ves